MINWYLAVLKNYAGFSGRARRSEYWYFALCSGIISIGLLIIDSALGLTSSGGVGLLRSVYSLAVFVPSIAVAIRRMHDVGKSGWFLLIPIYNLILACTAGDVGPNEYGPDPKNAEAEGSGAALDSNI